MRPTRWLASRRFSGLGRLGMTWVMLRWILGHHADRDSLPVTVTIADGPPGPVVPDDFAGLTGNARPLNAGNAGVDGYLFRPGQRLASHPVPQPGGCAACGSAADRWTSTRPLLHRAGRIRRGWTTCSASAAAAGAQVIYSLRLLSPSGKPVAGLKLADAEAAGYYWGGTGKPGQLRDRERAGLARSTVTRAIRTTRHLRGNRRRPGQRPYPSYLATWQDFAGAGAGGGARRAAGRAGHRGLHAADLHAGPGPPACPGPRYAVRPTDDWLTPLPG